MTSVLYSAGLNFQHGNPVRQEIVSVRREVEALRKQVELLSEENQIYRKYLMKLTASLEDGQGTAEFTKDLMSLAALNPPPALQQQPMQSQMGGSGGGGIRSMMQQQSQPIQGQPLNFQNSGFRR